MHPRKALLYDLTVNRPKDRSGALVTPEKLREHRTSYNFLGPCCFCPALRGKNSTDFVEAAMFDRGDDEFVAMCPTDNCGYIGTSMIWDITVSWSSQPHSVFLGRIFEKGNMPTTTYPKRGELSFSWVFPTLTTVGARRQGHQTTSRIPPIGR